MSGKFDSQQKWELLVVEALLISILIPKFLFQELTRLNTEAAVVCVLSKVEELAKQANGEGSHWLEELSPLVIKLKSCAEVTAVKAKTSLTLITLEVRVL